MGGEWRDVQLDQVCDISRGASPRPIHEWVAETGIPWVKISDASSAGSRFIERTRECIQPEGRSKSVSVYPGDLILSNSATPGIPMFMGIEACIHDGWLLLRNFRGLDKLFAYYLLLHDRPALVEQGSGSVFTNLKTEILKKHRVRLPMLAEQQAIACVLGSLDDKIELNRKMNRTLEEMARAIFKSWFVDFDPVRAKAAVRRAHPDWTNDQVSRAACPKLKPEIAALFPDSFEDSELGEIPEGWRVGTLAEACEKPQYGFTASANNEPIGPRLLRITDINKTDWIDWEAVPYCSIESSQYQEYVLRRGDIVIARMADPGHGALIEEDVDAVFASYLIRFRPKAYMFQRYLQYWLRSDFYWHLVESRQSGTTRANLNAQVLGRFAILLPPSELLEEFTRIAGALRNDLVANVHQSRTLAALRDALLPKLISGELRVKDAEKLVLQSVPNIKKED